VKQIPLTRGFVALVDDEDFAELSQFKWHYHRGYAERATSAAGGKERRIEQMHRRIMGLPYGDPRQIDHVDHDGLDNRHCNLRRCSHVENDRYRVKVRGSSRYKGVIWQESHRKWRTRITYLRRVIHLGYFASEYDAACAYDAAAEWLFGDFALANR